MQPRQAQEYVWIGILHSYFMTIEAGPALGGETSGLVAYLDGYLSGLATIRYALTTNAAWPVYGIRDELAAKLAEDPHASLDAETAGRLRQAALMTRETLYAEGD